VDQSLSSLFDAAEGIDFKLYVTMDLYATGNGCSSRNAPCDSVCASDVIVLECTITSELIILLLTLFLLCDRSRWLQRRECLDHLQNPHFGLLLIVVSQPLDYQWIWDKYMSRPAYHFIPSRDQFTISSKKFEETSSSSLVYV
jgi:hypothetical protein